MFPNSKPQAKLDLIDQILKSNGVDLEKCKIALVGIRGYYLDSIGKKDKNDRGVYDDALFWVTKDAFLSFNANLDPSSVRKGKGTGSAKGMANLMPGVWLYKTGMHNGAFKHQAFRQAADVTVMRDCDPEYVGAFEHQGEYFYAEKGQFGINIHRGGLKTTGSAGCQTLPVSQWQMFKDFGYHSIERLKVKNFPYVLIDEVAIRNGKLKV